MVFRLTALILTVMVLVTRPPEQTQLASVANRPTVSGKKERKRRRYDSDSPTEDIGTEPAPAGTRFHDAFPHNQTGTMDTIPVERRSRKTKTTNPAQFPSHPQRRGLISSAINQFSTATAKNGEFDRVSTLIFSRMRRLGWLYADNEAWIDLV